VVPNLDAAAEKITPGSVVVLALPCQIVLVERLRLPTADAEEIEGMVRLKLERTLPWPDEVTSGYSVVKRGENESVVLVAALHTPMLDSLCEPLREKQVTIRDVTLYASTAAAACPKNQAVLLLYQENDQIILAVAEDGQLGYVHSVDAADPQILGSELPPILLTAEMEGVPSEFSAVLLDKSCEGLRWLGPLLGVPVELVSIGESPVQCTIDLLPPSWVQERRRLRRWEGFRARMIKAGVGVVGLVMLAIGYIVWLQFRVNAVDRKLEKLRPELATVQERQQRWSAVAPAFDPSLFPVELLYQVYQSLPSEDVRITRFVQELDSFTVEGEAPSAIQAIQFTDAIRANPELAEFSVEAGPPEILPNDHAQFQIFAKR